MLFLLLEEVADFAEEGGVFVFLFFLFFFFLFFFELGGFLDFVNEANHEEDNKGDDEEVEDALEEEADVNGGGVRGAEEGGDGNL